MSNPSVIVPGYQIKHQIGAGGMSVVYLAEQQSLHREVALKVMRPVVADESHSIARFEHEAKTIAQLYHPNIMSIYDVGHLADGTLFYAMPYLTHGDLTAVHWQDDEHIKSVFTALCDGLAFAHEHGVIHRDLKPENILFDAFGHPQIADFGIAISDQHKKWTKDNSIVGSLNYISPEQAQSQSVDARSDIYALGAMLYEVVSGKPVFNEKEELALMLAHVSQTPQSLAKNKQHWQAVISQCLEKKPNKRYPNAQALKHAIAGINNEHSITHSRPQLKQKHGWMALGSVLLLLFVIWLWPDTTTEPANHSAQNQPTQFISSGNSGKVSHDNDYIELDPINQNQALTLLKEQLTQAWQPEVASLLLDKLLFHLTTQPENSVTVAETYIRKLNESSLKALHQTELSEALAWYQLINQTQTQLSTTQHDQLLSRINAIQESFSQELKAQYAERPLKAQQQMQSLWPDVAFAAKQQTTSKTRQTTQHHPNDLTTVILADMPFLALTETEVTVQQFRRFANATALQAVRCKNPTTSSLRFSSKTWSNPGFAQKNNHPVVCVTWQQATDYAHWLSQKTGHKYRLPNAQEWLAAKNQKPTTCGQHNVAGTETQHLKIKQQRHPCQDGYVQTAPVKSFDSFNAVFGMQGNVREWLQGCKKKNKIQSLFTKGSQCDSHPTIGQSWLSGQQGAGDVSYEKSGQAWTHIGFRLIREL